MATLEDDSSGSGRGPAVGGRGGDALRALLGGSVLLQAYCITFKFPNLLAVQRERFRQQIFWVTDFSNRPGAGGPGGHAPEICCADRSGEMPANHHESGPRGRPAAGAPGEGRGSLPVRALRGRLCSPRMEHVIKPWPVGLSHVWGLCVVQLF